MTLSLFLFHRQEDDDTVIEVVPEEEKSDFDRLLEELSTEKVTTEEVQGLGLGLGLG